MSQSQISKILEKVEGTSVHDLLLKTEAAYQKIAEEQTPWYKLSQFLCPSGCGDCCKDFEPDLLECEALYMAAWMLENQPEMALKVAEGNFPFNHEKTCPFFDYDSEYHCTIYGGRAFICRLFGASSFYSKLGKKVWKPCKFYPESLLVKHIPVLSHRQYTEEETISIFGTIPPAMSDLMQESLSFTPDSDSTKLVREVLPQAINKLLWIINMNGNDNPNGSPNSPVAA